jgi:hypothetical protein
MHIERGDRHATQRALATAVAGGVSAGANACLFHGAPALEFVLSRAGHTDQGVRAAVDQVVAARLAAAARRRDAAKFPHLAEFDLIRGLTGLGALLLTREGPHPLTKDVLAYLVSLTSPIPGASPALPGWWSQESPGHEKIHGGHSNNGIAHGIAGPLALLSIAARQGFQIEGHAEAIDVFARWLIRFGSRYWITRGQLTARHLAPATPLRPSWCYGDLGIARVLQLAAIALGDPARWQAAERAAVAALADPARLDLVTDASLCHGWAGLLTVTRAIAADSSSPGQFTEHIQQLGARLASSVMTLPKPGLMEGQAGAQLALDGTNTTGWIRILLIG